MKHKIQTPTPERHATTIRGKFSSRNQTPWNSDCGDTLVMGIVKSKRKGTNQQNKRKVVATNKEPNVQSTDQCDSKQNVVAAVNLFG